MRRIIWALALVFVCCRVAWGTDALQVKWDGKLSCTVEVACHECSSSHLVKSAFINALRKIPDVTIAQHRGLADFYFDVSVVDVKARNGHKLGTVISFVFSERAPFYVWTRYQDETSMMSNLSTGYTCDRIHDVVPIPDSAIEGYVNDWVAYVNTEIFEDRRNCWALGDDGPVSGCYREIMSSAP